MEGRKRKREVTEAELEQEMARLQAEITMGEEAAEDVVMQPEKETEAVPNKYLDSSVDARTKQGKRRAARALQFVPQGVFSKKAQNLRLEQMTRQMQTRSSASADVRLAPLDAVAWWDRPFVKKDAYKTGVDLSFITSTIIVYPVVKPAVPTPEAAPLPLMLTDKEKAKVRRMRKLEAQREQQERVALGLERPPEDRLSLSSYVRMLASEAVEDPTAMETRVRAQMEKRKLKHEMHVEAHKLTKDQQREKARRKLRESVDDGVHCLVFSVPCVNDPRSRFKIIVNAEQYNLSGCLVVTPDRAVVLVEGGPKNTRKYARLLVERMDWGSGACAVAWQAVVPKQQWSGFQVLTCADGVQARQLLAEHGQGHVWDAASTV